MLSYDELTIRANAVSAELNLQRTNLKNAENRMAENATLQKYIYQFAKTKEVYDKYKKSGYSATFKEENIADILLHQAAKNHFKSLNLPKLPKIKDLKIEYAALLTNKKKAYKSLSDLKQESQEILNAKANVEYLLGFDEKTPTQTKQKDDKSL